MVEQMQVGAEQTQQAHLVKAMQVEMVPVI